MSSVLFFNIGENERNDVTEFSHSLGRGIQTRKCLKGSRPSPFKLRDAVRSEEKNEERATVTMDDLLKEPNFAGNGKA
ncbi:hypothetical protein RRG08_059121 [Elysia crispata]|uniref:Uncharacterized protein n=1 Tax=Elysia crispata TaxID=231223 RepID=A0AAE1CP31_9GAST|nr:hypothetical protein RRG08_059121 [Elysia crispata]